jgi:hypothetical protein
VAAVVHVHHPVAVVHIHRPVAVAVQDPGAVAAGEDRRSSFHI